MRDEALASSQPVYRGLEPPSARAGSLAAPSPLAARDASSRGGQAGDDDRHAPATGTSYREILTSSALIGSSSVVTILASLVRTKLLAIFLGPTGLGLIGVFTALTTMVNTASGMGITTSGVRQIADAVTSGDDRRIARAVAAVRQLRWRAGLLGAVLLAALSVPISRMTFGSADYALTIALLALVVITTALYEAHVIVIQGFRRMGDLARVAVLGTLLSVGLSVPILVFWREYAIVALLWAASAAPLVASWLYSRRIRTGRVSLPWRELRPERRMVLQLGVASMSAALMVAAIAYVVRVLLVRELGFVAAGIYQAATALSSVYCGFILTAMGADFLPRLSAAAHDDRDSNRLVNEQAEVGLLLALPGICATIAFAPILVHVLYSSQFAFAADLLRWQVLGVFLRVVSWPMGYLLLAKGKAALYFWTELSYNVLHAVLIWIGLQVWGLLGTGIAFFGLYIYYTLLMTLVTRRLTGFRWSGRNWRLAGRAAPIVALVFLGTVMLAAPWQYCITGSVTAIAALLSARSILALTGRRGMRETIFGVRDLLRGDPAAGR